MNKKSKRNELSYFKAALSAFLAEHFPHLANQKQLIRQRGDYAAEVFERTRREGATVHQALVFANAVLYDGFRFSVFDMVFDIVAE